MGVDSLRRLAYHSIVKECHDQPREKDGEHEFQPTQVDREPTQRFGVVGGAGIAAQGGRKETSHEVSHDGQHFVCDANDVRRHAANVKRRGKARERRAVTKDLLDSLNMHRVKGNLGGVYYE